MTKTRRNGPKIFPRWNKGVSHSGLHTDTRFFGRFGWNGTVYTTMEVLRPKDAKDVLAAIPMDEDVALYITNLCVLHFP